MTDKQLNILVDSIIGDNDFDITIGYGGKADVLTQDGNWVAAYYGDINFFIWPEFVKSNGVFDMLIEKDQIKVLNTLYKRISSMIKERIPNPSILDDLEYCCRLTGGYLFTK